MFSWLDDKQSRIIAMIVYIINIIVVGVVGFSTAINYPSKINIHCSRNDDKCVISQQAIDSVLKKNEFNVSSISNVKFDTPIFGEIKSAKGQSIQYNMVVSFNDDSQPFTLVLSPREEMSRKMEDLEDLEKSKNIINQFNEFLNNPNQMLLNININNDFAIFLLAVYVIVFVISIIWPIIICQLKKLNRPFIT